MRPAAPKASPQPRIVTFTKATPRRVMYSSERPPSRSCRALPTAASAGLALLASSPWHARCSYIKQPASDHQR